MIDIGTCFTCGIDRIKNNPAYYILASLIIAIVTFVFMAIAFMVSVFIVGIMVKIGLPDILIKLLSNVIMLFFIVIATIFPIPLFIGFWKGVKKEYEGGRAEIGDIFSAFNLMVPGVLNYGIASIMFGIGNILCYIPGLIVWPLMPMTVFFIVKGETDGLSALKKSIDLLMKNPIIIVFGLIFNIIGSLGIIACGVGMLVTIPFSVCALHKMFQQAIGEDSVPAKN